MRISLKSKLLVVYLVVILTISACGEASTPASTPTIAVADTAISTPLPPTATPTAMPTFTSTPTPIPGTQVIPLSSMNSGIPWLPIENTARPGVNYLGFNVHKPPFDNPTVRQAFAAATDRSEIIALIEKYQPERKARAAYTLTPPETLGRDLTDAVGIPYDPERAKELLSEAGYTDLTSFPPVTIFTRASGAGEYPGLPLRTIEAIAESWRAVFGIEVIVSATNESYVDRFASNPPDAFRMGWAADYNDPDNFIGELFNPNGDYHGEFNYGKFIDPEFISLVNKAASLNEPGKRQELYIQAEQLLVQEQAGVIPLYFGIWNIP